MNKLNIKRILSGLFLSCFVFCVFLMPVLAADGNHGLDATAEQAGADSFIGGPGKTVSVATIIGTVLGAVLAFVGVLFFGLMIYGGLLWMTARGNDQQVEKAKDLIIQAVIGIIIVLGAYAITTFIGGILK